MLVTGCGAEVASPPSGGPGTGKGDDGTGSGGTEPLAAADFLHQLGVVQCDKAFACEADFPVDAGATFEDAIGANPGDCRQRADDFYLPEAVEDSVDGGRIVYNAAAAEQCLAGITFPSDCPEYWQVGPTFPAICDATLIGVVADGGDCTIDFDCENPVSICAATGKCIAQN